MKLIKMFGLAMVAAVAVMALLGAGSASATSTALCKSDPPNTGGSAGLCPGADQLSGTTKIDGLQLGSGTLTTSLGSITCLGAHIKAESEAGLNLGSLLGHINVFTYLECTASLIGCTPNKPATVTTTVEPEFHLLFTEPGLGDLTVLKPATTVEIKCGGLPGDIKCKFAENDTVLGTVHNLVTGVNLPQVRFTGAAITGPGGGLCPKSGTLSTTLDLFYLDANGTELQVFIAK